MNIGWNAHVHFDTANAQWVGMGWGVSDDNPGNPLDYEALITVSAPPQANATLGKKAPNETVVLRSSDGLPCGPGPIQIDVTYKVSAKEGANGSQVTINIAEDAGQMPVAAGKVLAQASGNVGEEITVHVAVPGSCG